MESKGKEIYSKRFSKKQDLVKQEVWKVLCSDFLQQFISKDSSVLDLGAGDGVFIKNIKAKKKVAIDLMDNVVDLQKYGIECYSGAGTRISNFIDGGIDNIFMSNFLEHLETKYILLEVLEQCNKVLNENGKVIILQPNIRYVKEAYWDYIDHHIALTEKSLEEALNISNFKIIKMIPRFMPYTVKSKLGSFLSSKNAKTFMRYYLKFPIFWKILGGQTFVVARKI